MEAATKKRLNVFERYLSLWVALCMGAGILLAKALPAFTDAVRSWRSAEGRTSTPPSPC